MRDPGKSMDHGKMARARQGSTCDGTLSAHDQFDQADSVVDEYLFCTSKAETLASTFLR